MAVVQLGDDIAGEGRLPAHQLDLVFQRAELLPLRGGDEAAQSPKTRSRLQSAEAVLDAVGVHDALAPVVAGLEPPRLLALLPAQILRKGKAPIAELGAHQRLLAGDHGIAMRRVEP